MSLPERCTLADGTRVVLRLVTPEDKEELRRGFERLSPESRYRRFFAAVSRLDDATLDYLVRVDGKDHVALAAFTESLDMKEEQGVGVARFIRVAGEPHVAEIAITVVDDFQRRGLGTLLLLAAVREARARGITHFRGETLPSNTAVVSMLDAAGATKRATAEGTVVFDVAIGAPREDNLLLRLLGMAARQVDAFLRRLAPPPR